jgi:hypothetical protein
LLYLGEANGGHEQNNDQDFFHNGPYGWNLNINKSAATFNHKKRTALAKRSGTLR